jgi:3-isopropylmalate dehydrogenase
MSGARKGSYTIALLPGDGIGPEIVAQARRVLVAAAELAGVTFEFEDGLIGGAAIDAAGTALPDDTTALC